ncbi:MAG: aminoacetone oxidase family FAD-binding enzyme, partial [Elusimicrobiota bacterium]|nr:aminoacetone oxidase family FAD-binding enzyme [Elusimicrobiota bacterium]
MKENRIAIIGAGASGLIAALKAGEEKSQVILLEKNHILGRKILSTGSGKCNLSNQDISPEHYNLNAKAFLKKVFTKVNPQEILNLFNDAGLYLKTETDGRIFPRCMNAQEVVNALSRGLEKSNIEIHKLTEVTEIIKKENGFTIKTQSVKPPWNKNSFKSKLETFDCEKIILACGSKSYPRIGGGDAGYNLAHSLGLKITNLSCSIVPLVVEDVWPRDLSGTRCDVLLSAFSDNKEIAKTSGEILFTDYGISGPAALGISRRIVHALDKGRVECFINFFPELSQKEMEVFFKDRLKKMSPSNKAVGYFLNGIFGDKISKLILNQAGIKKDFPLSKAKEDFIEKLIIAITAFKFQISSSKSFEHAMATAGGIELSQINPETFEVKGHKDLYITGELLDIDGDSGGYNLHFAWTSGFIAGTNAGKIRI